jgi:hypothetical protein
VRLIEVRPGEVRAEEVHPIKARPVEVRPGEVRPKEVRLAEVRFGEVRPDEVRPREVRPWFDRVAPDLHGLHAMGRLLGLPEGSHSKITPAASGSNSSGHTVSLSALAEAMKYTLFLSAAQDPPTQGHDIDMGTTPNTAAIYVRRSAPP